MAQSSPLGNHYQNGNGYHPETETNTSSADQDASGERGRARKKRDFFGTLKRRLGRSKSRAKSIERNMIPIDANNTNGELRSPSSDRISLRNSIGGGITSNASTGNCHSFILINRKSRNLNIKRPKFSIFHQILSFSYRLEQKN